MNRDKRYNNKKDTSNNCQSADEIQYVTLPYDFISFPEEWYPYEGKGDLLEWRLPRHDRRDQLSGYIRYKVLPQSDLAVEIKEGKDGRFFLGGSQMRGRVRTNLEVLSKSYPHFIDRSPMVFRDLAGDLRTIYQKRMNIQNIERSIQAGFLKKDGNDFYVVPAQKFLGDKYFVSIKEHRFINMGFEGGKSFSWLYGKNQFEEINKIQTRVDIITDEIKLLREQFKAELGCIQDKIDKLFTREFSFRKKLKRINKSNYTDELEKIKQELLTKLNQLRTEDDKLITFFDKMVERWIRKAEIDIKYSKLSQNPSFCPYQQMVYYSRNANGGIDRITFNPENDVNLKGYLFNSTNATSKRSHYFIKEEEKGIVLAVLPEVVQSYKQNYKKFRPDDKRNQDKIKDFYNIFDDKTYQKLIENNSEGPIVFFQTGAEGKLENIGRTPYFKIRYKYSIGDILQEEKKNKIGYADALFGFTPDVFNSEELEKENDNKNTIKGYKSRVRFSALDIKGEFDYDKQYVPEQFLFSSPFASASAMYLKQTDRKRLLTYEDLEETQLINKCKHKVLNGYKYYHILDKTQKSRKEPENMISTKGVMKNNNENDGFYLEGKVYFHNLSPQELGLLLLSLDIKEVLQSHQYDFIDENRHLIHYAYEQIGGAKPYGYGKVRIEIENLYLENRDHSFEALTLNPIEEKTDRYEYVDAFLKKMYSVWGKDYFKNYIESKQETKREEKTGKNYSKENPKTINWYNLSEKVQEDTSNKGGGYPKGWRLWRKS